MSLTKVILIVIVSCFAILSISACASTASEGNAVKDHADQKAAANESTEQTQTISISPSCGTPPKVLYWSNKTFYLKETHSHAEPGTHLGYMQCENGSFSPADPEDAQVNVYSAGPSKDLLYLGEWDGKQGFALYSLTNDGK